MLSTVDETYTIGRLAERAEVPTSTVRYYEQRGLLKPEGRTSSNYRLYGPESLKRLRFVRIAQTSAIGDQLEELGSGGEDLDALGRLEEMAEEARDISDRLGQGQLDRETLSRQERMFKRLLDAGHTLEKDEEDPNRRESETGGDQGRPDVEALDPALLTGPRFQYPNEEQLRSVPPAYRGMILDYFDRLNSEEGRP